MLLTQALGLPITQSQVDFVIPDIDEDRRLCIDPFLLYKSKDPQLRALHERLVQVFNTAFAHFRAGGRAEMDRLIELHREHSKVAPEVEAAWLHHRFTQIHPFQDGNGRVARCLATLVFIRAGYFPLVIRDTAEERTRYLDASEAADRGDVQSLVSAFAASQRRVFVQALGLSRQVLDTARAEQEVTAVRDRLLAREKARRAEWEKAKAGAG